MRRVALMAGAAAASLGFAAVAECGAQPVRQRPARIAPDSGRMDSLAAVSNRMAMAEGELMRLAAQLMTSQEAEQRLAEALREAIVARVVDARLRDIQTQLYAAAARKTALASRLRLKCAQDTLGPEGYLGVNFTGIDVRPESDGRALYYFPTSPEIVSVEPGSPAQRGGLRAGDQLTAIGGYDVARAVPLDALLKPGARVVVRVLRGGREESIAVVVGKRPDDAASPCTWAEEALVASRLAPQVTLGLPPAPQAGQRPPAMPSRAAPAGGMVRGLFFGRPSRPDSVSDSARATFRAEFAPIAPFAPAGNMIGGAQLLPLDADWRETVGVDKGLLVLSVATGTPAEAAGLRKGDVIVSVADSAVASPVTLWRRFSEAGPQGVTLKVMRARRQTSIVLRPRDPRQ
ncbi:MAG: PDZ domain-containing protein [Gemmatimonadaceae bacterium]|nr:PDZ domain-containing protein [Gemmatimonadaceae bacterium]